MEHIRFLADRQPIKEHFFFGRRVDRHRNGIDFNLLRDWFSSCQFHHRHLGKFPNQTMVQGSRFRVIDVYDAAPPDYPYVALSYCWGDPIAGKHVKVDTEFFVLPAALPKTIEDAMVVVREVVLRYLWVDALCIVQIPDKNEDKFAQLDLMGAIYSMAVFTIAAASGSHANTGLVGMSQAKGTSQRTELVKGLRFALRFPTYDSIVADPTVVWNTRGWTFQKRLLSIRIFLFTDCQVYSQCPKQLSCKDTNGAVDRNILAQDDAARGDDPRGLRTYTLRVEQFTKRQLTVPGDSLNAFLGVLATIKPYLVRFDSGLPLKNFNSALLWHPELEGTANLFDDRDAVSFPSWCWARWQLPRGCKYHRGPQEDTRV